MSKLWDGNAAEGLCCCEYNDISGKRNHLLAFCCDCEAVDNAFDRCVTCNRIPDETARHLCATIEDRCRIPWRGGAIRVRLDLAIPACITPCGLLVASAGPVWTWAAFAGILLSLLMMLRFWLCGPHRRRTVAFFVFTMTTIVQLYVTYVTIVVGFREVLLWETMLLTTLFAFTVYFLFRTRENPGVVEAQQLSRHSFSDDQSFISEFEVTWVDSRPINNGRLITWCDVCQANQPPRASHCTLCGVCVRSRDHHCIWIDSCIGDRNHRNFVMTLLLLLITGFYGAHLTMTTVCTPEMYLNWFLWPNDCRFTYTDFPTALSFVSACYAYIGVAFVSVILFQQLILVSQNVTLVEVRRAALRGWTAVRCLPLFVSRQRNVNNRGFYQNWRDFVNGSRRQRYLHIVASA